MIDRTDKLDKGSLMTQEEIENWRSRLLACIKDALPGALRTITWLLALTVPISFVVFLLKVSGILAIVAGLLEPGFALLGLPGESAIVFATAALVNIYSCIAVIETLGLTGRTVTILALMCLIAHNLPVESAVQKKTGSPLWIMVTLRLVVSFAGAAALNRLLPADSLQLTVGNTVQATVLGFWAQFGQWARGISWLCVQIILIVTVLMILQRILEQFGITRMLSNLLKYPLMVLGIPQQAAFLWIVANTLGLAYGSGVMIDHVERGKLSRQNAAILNQHIAISHSLLEDTLLFVAIGVSAWWITVPRVILAGIVVWLWRLMAWYNKHKKGRAIEAAKT